jgi:hypothetical protein
MQEDPQMVAGDAAHRILVVDDEPNLAEVVTML